MEDTADEQKGALTVDPVVQVFALAIVEAVASCAASSRREIEGSLGAEADRIAITARIKPFLLDRLGISQDAPEEAFDRIAATFQSRGQEWFGAPSRSYLTAGTQVAASPRSRSACSTISSGPMMRAS